jgi:predicted phosphoribosyltransferase
MAAKSDVVAPGLFRDRREAGRLLATKLSAFLTIINDLMGGIVVR